jgi:uncharacterized protein
MAWVRRLVLIPLIVYVVVVGLLLVFEKRLIFFPQIPGRFSGDWSPPDLAHEEIWLKTADGVRLNAWWIPSQMKSEGAEFVPTFLCFHGNAANIAWRADYYRFLRDLPANVLAVEYRGYGRSEGSPGEMGFYRDADAAYQYLVHERAIPPRQIIALGQSLGTAVAAELASQRETGGIVLEAPFPSARSLARRIYWFVPGLGWLIRSRFDTSRNLQQANQKFAAPLLVIHCTEDPVIPFAFGREVHDAAPEPKTFLAVAGRCHEEASLMDPHTVRRALLEFLQRVGAEPTAHPKGDG